jgi:putative phosphoribosyl transferase
MALFVDRRDAGRKLAARLAQSSLHQDAIILALPRGGVPVGFEVARALDLALDVFVVRKLGVPGHSELAMGAIATGEIAVFNEALIRGLAIQKDDIDAVVAEETRELHRREALFRGKRGAVGLEGRTVILVDDGLATGATMTVAVKAVEQLNPAKIIVAAPVASGEAFRLLQGEVDQIVTYATPSPFFGVGAWYDDFAQTTDEEVRELLARGSKADGRDQTQISEAAPRGSSASDGIEAAVAIETGEATLHGDLIVPHGSRGLVVFAHGSGSSRHSERNRHVAEVLREHGLGTLLLDLLTPEEEYVDRHTRHLRFDIRLLARRVVGTLDWLVIQPELQHLPVGLFGASTGAAAALVAAAVRPDNVRCVVSRGGRPDLAGEALAVVTAPTLLLVGGNDVAVIGLNEEAMDRMKAQVELEIVPGATHLFEEPGTLDRVAEGAASWFDRYLSLASGSSAEAPGP